MDQTETTVEFFTKRFLQKVSKKIFFANGYLWFFVTFSLKESFAKRIIRKKNHSQKESFAKRIIGENRNNFSPNLTYTIYKHLLACPALEIYTTVHT